MSGPKIYTPPPPRYSVKVFDGDLNAIFDIQIEIKKLIGELKKLECLDAEKGVHISAQEFLKKNNKLIEKALSSFSIEHRGLFGQSMYDHFKKQIAKKRAELREAKEIITAQKQKMMEQKEDYEAYVEYDIYFRKLKENFQKNQEKIVKYLEKFSTSQNKELISDAQNSISQIEITCPQSQFSFGFRNRLSKEKEKIADAIKKGEAQISSIRNQLSDKIIELCNESSSELIRTKQHNVSSKIKEKINSIEELISTVADEFRKQQYLEKLEKLQQSPTQSNDEFFYDELHDEILTTERTIALKKEIQTTLSRLNEIDFHQTLLAEKQSLIQKGLALLERRKINQNQFGDFLSAFKSLELKNLNKQKEDELLQRERNFLKQQLVTSLKSMGYEVITESEVIDFTKEEEFLLQIPNQENFINIRFLPDGRMLYNFLIPEDRETLSSDQVQRKLSEMQRTCDEFKSLLKDLSQMGLSLSQASEKPVSESVLIKVPAKYDHLIRREKKRERKAKPEEKKRYLG